MHRISGEVIDGRMLAASILGGVESSLVINGILSGSAEDVGQDGCEESKREEKKDAWGDEFLHLCRVRGLHGLHVTFEGCEELVSGRRRQTELDFVDAPLACVIAMLC